AGLRTPGNPARRRSARARWTGSTTPANRSAWPYRRARPPGSPSRRRGPRISAWPGYPMRSWTRRGPRDIRSACGGPSTGASISTRSSGPCRDASVAPGGLPAGVDTLARGGLIAGGAVPQLLHQDLVEPDGPAGEGHRRAREVEQPGSVDLLAHDGARLVGAGLQSLGPVATGPRVVLAQVLQVEQLPARPLHLGERLGHAREIAVGEHVAVQEVGLTRALPVGLVVDAVVQVEAAVDQHLLHAPEERGVVRDADVLDHPDRGDLVVTGVGGQIAQVPVLDQAAVLEPLALDPGGRPLRLLARQGHPVGPDAVVLRGPDAESAPAAADVEHPLARLQAQLAADQIELVGVRLLESCLGGAVVGAGVDHQRIEEQGVEVVRDVVMVRDRLRVVLLGPRTLCHGATSRMPKMESKTMRRRAAAEPMITRTPRRASESGRLESFRESQPSSPGP